MRGKTLIVMLSCVTGFLLVLIAVALLVPPFMERIIVRQKIIQGLSRTLGANAQVSQVSLSLLPRPRVVLYGVILSFPGDVACNIKTTDVYLALIPLLAGEIRPARIRIEAPYLNIPLQKREKSDPGTRGTFTLAGLHKQVTSALAPMVEKLPPGSFSVEGGTVRMGSTGSTLFSLSELHGRIDVSSDLVSVDLKAHSNLWEKQALQISIRPDDLSMEGVVSVSRLDPRLLAEYFFPDAVTLGSSAIDATLKFSVDGTGALRTGLDSSISYLTLLSGEKKQVIKGTLHKVLLKADAQQTSVSFSAEFDYPKLNAVGKYFFDNSSREITIDVDGENIDLLSCKDVVRVFFAKAPLIRAISDRLDGGIITDISLEARGLPGTDLIENKNFALTGSFSHGRIIIPEANLDLQEVSGEVSTQGGLLKATNLQAHCEDSKIYDGTVHLDLINGFRPLQVESMFSCDLAQLSRLAAIIPDQGLREELLLIKAPQGTASGKLIVREEKGSYTAEADVSALNVRAGYRSFPTLLTLSKGTCVYRNRTLTFRDFTGKLGRSAIQNISARFDLDDNRLFEIKARHSAIELDELLLVLNSFRETQNVTRNITQGTGRIGIQSLYVTGPLSEPEQWKFSMQGTASNLSLTAGMIDRPVAINRGEFNADNTVFSLRDAGISLFDSSLNGSFTLEGYLKGIERVTVDVRGTLGPLSLSKAVAHFSFPEDLVPLAPLSIARSQVIWLRNRTTNLTADLSSAGGVHASLALQAAPELLEIKKLNLSDKSSDCTFRIDVREDILDVTYRGMLKKETLDRLLVNNRLLQGWITGDFTAHLEDRDPLKSTAMGTLSWQEVQYFGIEDSPLRINSASISAEGKNLLVHTALVTVGASDIQAQGNITFAEEGYFLDLSLASESLDLDDALTAISCNNDTGGADEDEFWEIPLRGRAAFAAKSLILDQFTWSPFSADFAFSDKRITVSVRTDTELCEVATPGFLVLTPDQISLSTHAATQNASFQNVLSCLTGEAGIVTGKLNVSSDLTAEGPASDLLNNLRGTLSVSARKGRIFHANLLTNILSFLSVRNLLLGRKTDIAKKGFAYNSIDVKADIRGNTLIIGEGMLDSYTLNIACQGSVNLSTNKIELTMLATPFQIYDLIVMSIPVVGGVFGSTLVGVPIKVTGTIDKQHMGLASPSEIGKKLLDGTINIIKRPVKIIQDL